MVKSFNTKIIFRRSLSHQEQFAFWNKIIVNFAKMAISSSTHFRQDMDWSIDYSDSNLNEYEAKKRFSVFLERENAIIKDYSFYQPFAQIA